MAFTDVDATWLNTTASYDANELRRTDGALMAGASGQPWGGIARHSDTAMNVTVDGSLNVTVQPGSVVIPGSAVAETGVYRSSIGAAQTDLLAARHATNPRITIVVFRVYDDDVVNTHNAYKGRIEFVDGTPGAVPSAPALPSMAVELARITVPQTGGGAASVDLTYRTFATAAGGILYVPTSDRLPASAAKWQRALAIDTVREYLWSGSSWVVVGGWVAIPGINFPNLPLNAGSTTGRYSINNTTVSARVQGVASGAAGGPIFMNLPVPASVAMGVGGATYLDGTAVALNQGTGHTVGLPVLVSSTQIQFVSVAAPGVIWGTAAPHTWKATDVLTVNVSYEMA